MIWIYISAILSLAALSVFLFLLNRKNEKQKLSYLKELRSFENIVYHTNDSLYVIEIINGKLLHVNHSAAEFLGYTVEELLSKTYFDLLPKEYLQRSAEVIADVWEQKGLVFTDIPFLHKNKEVIPAECSAKMGSFDNNPAIVIYARDIRERLRYENEIKEINSTLTETNKLVSEKNKEITDSINYARRIQYGILPNDEDLKKCFDEYFVLYQPKDIVSGDFYWAISTTSSVTQNKLSIIAAVDCTGHGVPGAFMSMLGYTLLNQTIQNPEINSPSDVLNFLNSELPKNLRSYEQDAAIRDGMDISLCAIDYANMKIYFSGANNPCWIIRNNNVTKLKADKQAISASVDLEKKSFTTQQYDLQKGDCIYLFTDGYADQFGGPHGKKFKYKQLEELLLKSSSDSLGSQKEVLTQEFNKWKGGLEQVDDVLVVGVRV
jgi:PAS domain S-box-containing protein